MEDVETEGGGSVERIDDILKADSDDSARLTLKPLSDNEFDFVVNAVRHQRIEKAARLNEALLEIHGVRHYRELRVNPDTIPVLTWANPSEFERMIDYAATMRADRDALTTKLGAILLGQGPPESKDVMSCGCASLAECDCEADQTGSTPTADECFAHDVAHLPTHDCCEPDVPAERGRPVVTDPFGDELEGEWETGAQLVHQRAVAIADLQKIIEGRTEERDEARRWAKHLWGLVQVLVGDAIPLTLKSIARAIAHNND